MFQYSNLAICSSDWHLTAAKPINRHVGYDKQQFIKVTWILKKCREYSADLYLAGDVFDRAREPRWLVSEYTRLFREYGVNILACAGQHDQAYHSKDLRDTSINSLYSAGLIHHSKETMDWGADIPEQVETLIAHYCVTEKPNPFIDYSVTASKFMTMTKAKLIVTGDYHKAHHLEKNGRLLINPGSIMRNASDSINKEPVVYLVDVSKNKIIDVLKVPILPAGDVFDLSGIQRHKEDKARKEEMGKRFDDYILNASNEKIRPNFPKNVLKVVADTSPAEAVKNEIDNIMEKVT